VFLLINSLGGTMAEKTNKDSGITGVLVLGGGINAENWMKNIKARHEAPNHFGKSKTVEFEIADDYIRYQVA
jgi:hypothetical protein